MTLAITDFDSAINGVMQIEKLADMLMKSSHYKKLGLDGIYSVLFAAKSLNIDPFQALNGGLYCIQGKVGMSTELMASIIRKGGHSVTKDPLSDHTQCTLTGKRKDSTDSWTCTFSMKDAEAAGLAGSATYKKYPGIMLYNRCMSMLARQLFPDVIKGYGYCEDEINEIQKVKPLDIIMEEAQVVEKNETKIEPVSIEFINIDEIESMNHLINKLDEDMRKSFFDGIKKTFNVSCIEEIPKSGFDKSMISLHARIKFMNDKNKESIAVA